LTWSQVVRLSSFAIHLSNFSAAARFTSSFGMPLSRIASIILVMYAAWISSTRVTLLWLTRVLLPLMV
jgi:hypothetical protein